jgi:CTP:molybdopterin cytidylyltransferase MocA
MPYKGHTVLQRAIAPLLLSPFIDDLILVVQPDFDLDLQDMCTPLMIGKPSPVRQSSPRIIHNCDYTEGMGSSLRIGIAASSLHTSAYLISLADMPEIHTAIIANITDHFWRSGKGIAIPTIKQRRGHPVIISAKYREQLLQLRADIGAKNLINSNLGDVEFIPLEQPAIIFDVDQPEDLELQWYLCPTQAELERIAKLLQHAEIYCEIICFHNDPNIGCAGKIGYYPFDKTKIKNAQISQPM